MASPSLHVSSKGTLVRGVAFSQQVIHHIPHSPHLNLFAGEVLQPINATKIGGRQGTLGFLGSQPQGLVWDNSGMPPWIRYKAAKQVPSDRTSCFSSKPGI